MVVRPDADVAAGMSLTLHCAAMGVYQNAGSWPRL